MSIVLIKIPDNISKRLSSIKVPGEIDENKHITVFYFNDDTHPYDSFEILRSTYDAIRDEDPITITIDSISNFDDHGSGYPIKCDVKSDGLLSLREKIKAYYDYQGIKYDTKWKDFIPHITLSYNERPIKPVKIKPITFTVDRIYYYGGSMDNEFMRASFKLDKEMNENLSFGGSGQL